MEADIREITKEKRKKKAPPNYIITTPIRKNKAYFPTKEW